MASPDTTRAAPALAGSDPCVIDQLGGSIDHVDIAVTTNSQAPLARVSKAKTRFAAWCHVLDAVADMRNELDCRIGLADPDDVHLEADCHTWCTLAQALADFLTARRSA